MAAMATSCSLAFFAPGGFAASHFCPRAAMAASFVGSRRPPRAGRTISEGWDLSFLAPVASPSTPASLEEIDTTNMLLRQRIVFLGSQVDTMIADLIISQLLLLDAEDQNQDIKLFINSPGGSIPAGIGIYDAMKLCKADISTVCLGIAAAVSAFLLAAGSKGKRFCMPNARVMIHQPLGNIGGSPTESGVLMKETMYQTKKVMKILSRITGKPEEQVEADTDWENYMNPWQAKEYGLVDTIIDDGKPSLIAPIIDPSPPPDTKINEYWIIGDKMNLPSEEKLWEN